MGLATSQITETDNHIGHIGISDFQRSRPPLLAQIPQSSHQGKFIIQNEISNLSNH